MRTTIKSRYIKQLRAIAVCCLLSGGVFVQKTIAQSPSNATGLLNPSGTMFFQNQYLGNAAMAGIDSGLHLNAAHRRQWQNSIDGAPVTTFFSADVNTGNRGGAGLNVMSDVAGLINRTRLALSYAYHMPLSSTRNQFLHFGMSLSFNFQRIDMSKIDGDINDPALLAYNARDNYFEGDFGMAYTDEHWNVQAALPNIRAMFTGINRGINGGTLVYSAASYKFKNEGAVSTIEPKVAYRNIRGFDDIIDAGVNVSFLDDVANVMAMYHTSKSFTAGIGVNIKKTAVIQLMYTTQTGGIRSHVDGSYEVGATVNLFK
ncbi:PorP/SprF family type IX secretion system membrane protein [Longitalea luteola]|uniref:PorP/SprF family type IX secretion system membrane protein n=1 Tax=Longitalea luteola TaxID=2812563 RepID=UPI001A95D224|nr:PorP/SprF family type IX secretion system membrane protein [Longitalea luteola]